MGIIESLFYVIGFFAIFMITAGIIGCIDIALHKVFGKGLFPKGYWDE